MLKRITLKRITAAMTLLAVLGLAGRAALAQDKGHAEPKTTTAEPAAMAPAGAPPTEAELRHAEELAKTHGVAGEHEAAPLLPGNLQEAQEHFLAPAVWTLIIFLILLAILYPMAWKPILAGLKAREKRIRDDIAQAEETRAKAEATLSQYNQQLAAAETRIRDMLTKAQADGEKLATNIRMQAQTEAEDIKERAQRDIESAKNAAIGDIYAQAADLSTTIAEKILRRNLNADDQRALVQQSLDQLQNVKV